MSRKLKLEKNMKVNKLKVKESNWNSYLTDNKYQTTREERLEKKKMLLSKHNIFTDKKMIPKQMRSKIVHTNDINSLDLIDNPDIENNNISSNNSNNNDMNESNHKKIYEDHHRTFSPNDKHYHHHMTQIKKHINATPKSYSRSMNQSNASRNSSPTSDNNKASSAIRIQPNNITVIHNKTSTSNVINDNKSVTKLSSGNGIASLSTIRPSLMSSFNQYMNHNNEDIDPDWIHITADIKSLFSELKYYEELSGKRSILDTTSELEDILAIEELKNPKSSKTIMQYLLTLVCQSLSYLLKNELDLQEERSKNDLLQAQLEEIQNQYKELSTSTITSNHNCNYNPTTTSNINTNKVVNDISKGNGINDLYPSGLSSLKPTTTKRYNNNNNNNNTLTNNNNNETESNTPNRNIYPLTYSTTPVIGYSKKDPTSHEISFKDTRVTSPDTVNVVLQGTFPCVHQKNTMSSNLIHSSPYVDAYESYHQQDDFIHKATAQLLSSKNEEKKKESHYIRTKTNEYSFPVADFTRMDALINYSKNISIDNEYSTIERLVSTTNNHNNNSGGDHYTHNVSLMYEEDNDSSDEDSCNAPPPPPLSSEKFSTVTSIIPPLPHIPVASAPLRQHDRSLLTNSEEEVVALHMLSIENSKEQDGYNNTSSTTMMKMNGTSASDWLFSDFSVTTPLPTYQHRHRSITSTNSISNLNDKTLYNDELLSATTNLYANNSLPITSHPLYQQLNEDTIVNKENKNPIHDISSNNDNHHHKVIEGDEQERFIDRVSFHIHTPSYNERQSTSSSSSSIYVEQNSIIIPYDNIPSPHKIPIHPYHHQTSLIPSKIVNTFDDSFKNINPSNNPRNNSESDRYDVRIATINGYTHIDENNEVGFSPMATKLMEQWKFPTHTQKTFDARYGSF